MNKAKVSEVYHLLKTWMIVKLPDYYAAPVIGRVTYVYDELAVIMPFDLSKPDVVIYKDSSYPIMILSSIEETPKLDDEALGKMIHPFEQIGYPLRVPLKAALDEIKKER